MLTSLQDRVRLIRETLGWKAIGSRGQRSQLKPAHQYLHLRRLPSRTTGKCLSIIVTTLWGLFRFPRRLMQMVSANHRTTVDVNRPSQCFCFPGPGDEAGSSCMLSCTLGYLSNCAQACRRPRSPGEEPLEMELSMSNVHARNWKSSVHS